MLVVVKQTPYAAPRTWHVATGVTLNGYDPARPGVVVKSIKWDHDSSAHAIGEASVAYPGMTTPPAPNGGPFLLCSDGTYAGLLIVKSLVTLDPAPVVPDSTPYDQTYVNQQVTAAVAARNDAWEQWVAARPK